MNDTMSLGIHRLWKDSFVTSMLPRLPPSFHQNPSSPSSSSSSSSLLAQAPTPTRPPFRCLDVAGGTGDIALRILDRAKDKFACRDIEVEVVDLTEGMLVEGRKRVAKTLYYNSECLCCGFLRVWIKWFLSLSGLCSSSCFIGTSCIAPAPCGISIQGADLQARKSRSPKETPNPSLRTSPPTL